MTSQSGWVGGGRVNTSERIFGLKRVRAESALMWRQCRDADWECDRDHSCTGGRGEERKGNPVHRKQGPASAVKSPGKCLRSDSRGRRRGEEERGDGESELVPECRVPGVGWGGGGWKKLSAAGGPLSLRYRSSATFPLAVCSSSSRRFCLWKKPSWRRRRSKS